jgi:hypothetical protein
VSDYGSAVPPPGYGQQPGYGQPSGPPPNNYLVPAILTLFCCWPLAIPAIVFASQVNSKYAAGDVAGAQDASQKAKRFAIWSAIAGVILTVLYVIFLFVLGGLASMSDTA